jgi:hypothetical protein
MGDKLAAKKLWRTHGDQFERDLLSKVTKEKSEGSIHLDRLICKVSVQVTPTGV